MKRKIIVIVMSVALIMNILTGCGNSGGNSTSAEVSPTAAEGNSEVSNAAESDGAVNKSGYPIMNEEHTFKIVHAIGTTDKLGSWEDKELTKKIEEETGLVIEWVGIPQSSYNEQVGIMIAAGDLPDVFINGVPNFAQFVDSFVALDNYIDDYAPSVSAFYEEYPEIKLAGIFPDGSIYGFPYMQANNFHANNSLTINYTWLDTLGLDAPETLDELFDVLTAFKEKDPNGNGMADEIPYGFRQNRGTSGVSFGFEMIMHAFGIYGSAIDDYPYLMVEGGDVVFYPEMDGYYEYLEYMHKLYSNGLLDPNGFVQEETDMIAKGSNNQYGMFMTSSYDDIIAGDYASDFNYLEPLKNKYGERNYFANRYSGDVAQNKFVITSACEYPEAMVRLYDYVNSSFDNKVLFAWGPEGISWERNEDGSISRLNATLPEGYNSYAEVRHTYSMGVMGFTLWTDTEQAMFAITNDRDVKYLSREEPYMQYAIEEYIPIGQDKVESSQEISILLTEISNYMENFEAECIMMGIDQAKWESHLQNVKTFNVDRYVELRQEFYDRMLDLLKQ